MPTKDFQELDFQGDRLVEVMETIRYMITNMIDKKRLPLFIISFHVAK